MVNLHMLDDFDQIQTASDLLFRHWQEGSLLDNLPEELRPTDRIGGYAIQARLEQRSARPLFGWKIAATSLAGQAHINVDGPLAGRLLAERVIPQGVTVAIGNNQMRVAEPEFAFVMGRDLLPRSNPRKYNDIADAVAALHLAIEIPDSRFIEFVKVGAAQLIADNACAHQFILGDKAPEIWRDMDLVGHKVVGTVIGKLHREGSGAAVLGDPRFALTWLVNELSQLGITLRAGEVITTGTCMVPLAISAGDQVEVDYGILGHIKARFSA
jgi:2-keto-4-pentenoate hydratase